MGRRWWRPGAPADMAALPATLAGRLGATAVRGGRASGAHPMSRRGRRRASRRRLRPRTPEAPHAAPPHDRADAVAGCARGAGLTRGEGSASGVGGAPRSAVDKRHFFAHLSDGGRNAHAPRPLRMRAGAPRGDEARPMANQLMRFLTESSIF